MAKAQGEWRRETYSSMEQLFRDNDNKTDFFNFLADKTVERCQGTVVIVTKEEGAVSNQLISLEGMAPFNHEEADSRLFMHARHAVEQGHTSLIIKASVKDVLQMLNDIDLQK